MLAPAVRGVSQVFLLSSGLDLAGHNRDVATAAAINARNGFTPPALVVAGGAVVTDRLCAGIDTCPPLRRIEALWN
ncbi:hypothetical protein [Nocardia nova]|nr:hypothetical protein [Nocardia nova]